MRNRFRQLVASVHKLFFIVALFPFSVAVLSKKIFRKVKNGNKPNIAVLVKNTISTAAANNAGVYDLTGRHLVFNKRVVS
jgi:hypothetical protein